MCFFAICSSLPEAHISKMFKEWEVFAKAHYSADADGQHQDFLDLWLQERLRHHRMTQEDRKNAIIRDLMNHQMKQGKDFVEQPQYFGKTLTWKTYAWVFGVSAKTVQRSKEHAIRGEHWVHPGKGRR